jgi:flagellar export protein FliJ
MTRQQKTVAKILEVKGMTKDQLEAEVRKANERLRAEENRLAALEQEHRHTSDDLAAKQQARTIAVTQLDLFYTYLKHLEKQIANQKTVVALRAQEHERAMQALVEAYKEHRLIEILHDKIDAARKKAAIKGEQKETDYLHLTRKDR